MIQIKRILAATDFSEHSQNALQYAVAFADEFAAPVYLFHALGHATEFGFTGVPIEQLYENLLSRCQRSHAGIESLVRSHGSSHAHGPD